MYKDDKVCLATHMFSLHLLKKEKLSFVFSSYYYGLTDVYGVNKKKNFRRFFFVTGTSSSYKGRQDLEWQR